MSARPWQSFLIALALVLAPLLCSVPRPVASGSPGIYIAVGDSIAAGVGSSLPRARSYPALVNQWMEALNGTPLPYVNLAEPGETAESFVGGEQWQAFQTEVGRAEAAGIPLYAVTVSLGGNELLTAQHTGLADRQAALDEFRTTFDQAVGLMRGAIGPETPLVLTSYYDVTEGDVTQMFTDAWWIAQFNQVISESAERHGAQVADLESLFRGQVATLTRYPADVHPTNQGFRAIAEAVWRALDFDQQAPSVEISSPERAERRTPTLRFEATDQVGVSALVVVAGDVEITPVEVAPGEYVALLELGANPDQPLSVVIETSDAAGNITRSEQQVRFALVSEDTP